MQLIIFDDTKQVSRVQIIVDNSYKRVCAYIMCMYATCFTRVR